jgi:RNA polymerase sigma-70 factor (ECF subfamily)
MTEKMARFASSPAAERPDDAELVAEARRNPQAFAQLYLLYVQPVFRYLYSRLGSRADAEDATAQTFLAALDGFAGYRHQGYFAAWLFSIARRKAADTFRRKTGLVPLAAAGEVPVEADLLQDVIHSERKAALGKLIAALPDEEQDLLRLRYTAELTFSEISRLLGRSEGALKKVLYRLLARMQDQLEDSRD